LHVAKLKISIRKVSKATSLMVELGFIFLHKFLDISYGLH